MRLAELVEAELAGRQLHGLERVAVGEAFYEFGLKVMREVGGSNMERELKEALEKCVGALALAQQDVSTAYVAEEVSSALDNAESLLGD